MKKYLIFFLLAFCVFASTNAQNSEVLPSIIVVPRVKANQDLRKLVDESPTVRAGMASIKDGFDQFQERTAVRILKDNRDQITLNNCPNCSKLTRTPNARQCRHCGHNWHA